MKTQKHTKKIALVFQYYIFLNGQIQMNELMLISSYAQGCWAFYDTLLFFVLEFLCPAAPAGRVS